MTDLYHLVSMIGKATDRTDEQVVELIAHTFHEAGDYALARASGWRCRSSTATPAELAEAQVEERNANRRADECRTVENLIRAHIVAAPARSAA